jgi:hypothetical protein
MYRPYSYCLAIPMVIAIAGTCVAAPATRSDGPQVQSPALHPVQATVEIIAPRAPPPPRVEAMPPPPPNAVAVTWQAGYWSWSGGNWVWVAGHYVERPSPTAAWEPGHWTEQPNGWLWVEGRWRVAQR